jgi:hypothetical protein
MQKFQVIKVDCQSNDIEILSTLQDYKSSTEFLSLYLNKNFEMDSWTKCVCNNNNSVSVFEYGYIFPKKLKFKIHIVAYTDARIE